MAASCLPFALLGACLACAQGFQRSLMEVVVPQRVPPDVSGNTDKMTFIITIERIAYTIHLKRQSLLSNDFRVYTYNPDGSLKSVAPSIARNCYYQGYIEDFMDSVVTLSSCMGLEGLLQFKNDTYGIEPMGNAVGFQHLVYQLKYENVSLPVSAKNYSIIWKAAELAQKPVTDVLNNFMTLRYLEIYIVLARDLYKFWGAAVNTVTEKIIRLIGFVNAMFSSLYVKIILTSLEIWAEKDQIPTTGNVEKLLEKFAKWKQSHLSLRPHDVAVLFVSRNQPSSVGSTFARKICLRASSAGIAVKHRQQYNSRVILHLSTAVGLTVHLPHSKFQKGITLENFSVRITQLLAFGLGIRLDNSSHCQCSGSTCIMHTSAIQSSGSKFFSSCSLSDYQSFLRNGDAHCLMNKPRMDLQIRAPFCGNKIVEEGEQCDCGTEKQCKSNPCCDTNCKLKKGKTCAHGPCCWNRHCKLKAKGTLCRTSADKDCDLKEYCNGTSAECTENLHVQDGQQCEGGGAVCMQGVCQSADRWCKKVFGKGSKNGSPQCYEEINSQKDRMGHCGSTAQGYETCQWQDLRCGKLVCEYPSQKPFAIENAAIIYARVQNRWCVTLDYMRGPGVKDPFLVHDGTGCGQNKICMKQKCVDRSVIPLTCDAQKNCNGKGVCNNRGNCHCNKGWAPPDCIRAEKRGLGGSIDSTFRGAVPGTFLGISPQTRNWLLMSFLLFLPATAGFIFLVVKLRDVYREKEGEEREDDYDDTVEGESDTERSQELYPSETETASV